MEFHHHAVGRNVFLVPGFCDQGENHVPSRNQVKSHLFHYPGPLDAAMDGYPHMGVATTPKGEKIDLYNNSYALVVGNGNYKNGWDPLPGAIQDVDDVAEALRKDGFNVTLEKNLTRTAFYRVFGNFCHLYGRDPNNRLLFYYAGHRHTQKMANDEDLGFLVMVDAPSPRTDPVGFELSSIDMQSMVTRAKQIKARHVLFMFDSCFSGSILNLREQVMPENISASVKLPVRQFITAGRANEPVPDHSIFKVAFLDLLKGRGREPNPDGYITGEELGFYPKNTVPKYNRLQHPQYGKIRDIHLDKGDFVFQLASSGAQVEKPDASRRTTLSVSANVNGARVLVDGKGVGETPLSDAAVSPGQHRIRIEKDGYDPYEKRVRIGRGRAVNLWVDLSQAGPRKARIYVEATPEDARVRILNIGPKFYQGMELNPGRYHVEVSADGYETKKQTVSLDAGEDQTLSIRLESVQKVQHPSPEGKVRNNLGMEFVYIPPGTFMMGSPPGESGRDNDERQHRVTLTGGFYMQTTEVTQGQWERVMGSNPSGFNNCGRDCPVEQVSWKDCQEFIRKLNQMEGTRKYRLPSEAEWEYACRAGNSGAIYTGDMRILGKNNAPALDPIAWYGGNSCVSYSGGYDCSNWPEMQKSCSNCGTHPAGLKQPNRFGLYDRSGMSGSGARTGMGITLPVL